MTPQETVPDLPVGIQESLVEAWVSGGLLQDCGQSVAVHAWEARQSSLSITDSQNLLKPMSI